jgi:hypothetical protein
MVSAIVYAKLNSGQIGAESFPAAIKWVGVVGCNKCID